ncbi:MAG: DUF411 domain-containing protein [Methylococcales bacterium]
MKVIKLLTLSLLLINTAAQAETVDPAKAGEMTVYRSPSCSCCGRWLEHVQKNNFIIKDIVTDEVQAIKDKYGVSADMASCHTAVIGGYVIEGHVPAQDIVALLTNKPAVTGISVPGMPVGTPGMEMGAKKDAYQVVSFDRSKHYQVFNSYK